MDEGQRAMHTKALLVAMKPHKRLNVRMMCNALAPKIALSRFESCVIVAEHALKWMSVTKGRRLWPT